MSIYAKHIKALDRAAKALPAGRASPSARRRDGRILGGLDNGLVGDRRHVLFFKQGGAYVSTNADALLIDVTVKDADDVLPMCVTVDQAADMLNCSRRDLLAVLSARYPGWDYHSSFLPLPRA